VEPFRVICETCRSRLKIRSAAAIGEIHACPKCGSMVQIAPPAGWTADAATPALAGALASVSSEPALSISPSSSTIVPADFGVDLLAEPIAARAVAPVIAETSQPVLEAAAAGISPVVWWAVGGAAVFVVAGLTYVLWPGGTKEIAKPAPAAAVTTTAAPVVPSADSKSNEQTPTAPADQQAAAEPAPYAVDHSTNAPVAAPSEEPKESAATLAPAEPTETLVAKTDDEAAKPQPATTPAAANAPEHVLKFDPLDFDPDHLSLSLSPAASTSSIPPESPGEIAPGEAASAAGNSKETNTPAAADLLPPPTPNQAVNVRRGPAAAEDARPLDTAQHLAMNVKSLQLTEIPLARFVDTLADMAGVPITLDPRTLELNGQSPRSTVSFDMANVTLEKVLQDALAELRLELVEQDGHVGIALADGDERRVVDFDVKDLTADADAGAIAKLLERFVGPPTWKANGGKGTIEVEGGTLHIDQSLLVRREALIFCERLRAARGLALRSKYPAELLTVDSPYEKLATKLNQSTTFTFLAWTRLADVVHQWQDMSGLTILVDWSALRDIDLGPSSPVACSTLDRPWSEALDGVLEPLGLGWWAIDGQTLQITSLDALERIERVEFYSVPTKLRDQFATGDALIESLQKEAADRPVKHGNPGNIRMELDEPSGRLIVRATPAVQRFLSGRLTSAAKQ
jgi:hypothetical protein